MDSQNAISYRNFASSMGDVRLLAKIDFYIQEHLLEVSEQDDFLKLPRLKVSSPGITSPIILFEADLGTPYVLIWLIDL